MSNGSAKSNSYWWSHHHRDTADFRLAVYQGQSAPFTHSQAIDTINALAAKAAAKQAHLLLFPELFLCGYDISKQSLVKRSAHINSTTISKIRSIARQHEIALSFGYSERAEDKEGEDYDGKVFNSALTIDDDGSIANNYRKSHLWQDLERSVFARDDQPFQGFTLKRHPAHRFGMQICFDVEFPEPSREYALDGVSILLVQTALATGDAANIIPQCVVPTRALENHCFVGYSNFCGERPKQNNQDDEEIAPMCGQSGIFAPDGHTIVRADDTSASLMIATLTPSAFVTQFKRTPYLPYRRTDLLKAINEHRHYSFEEMSRAEIAAAKQQEGNYGDDKFVKEIIPLPGRHSIDM